MYKPAVSVPELLCRSCDFFPSDAYIIHSLTRCTYSQRDGQAECIQVDFVDVPNAIPTTSHLWSIDASVICAIYIYNWH